MKNGFFCHSAVYLFLCCQAAALRISLNRIMPSDNQEIQDIHPDSTRIYMDELPGTVQSFTGTNSLLSVLLYPIRLMFLSTLESEDGIIRGDSVSVIYEGQLTDTDTSTVRALKVVDDYHTTDT